MIIKLAIPAEAANASDDNPVDMTQLIKTPTFDDGLGANSVAGWEGTEGYNFGNDDTQKAALAIEFYSKTFDINQTIKGLPNGTYKVAVSAFYRFGSVADDYAAYKADPSVAGNAFVYAVTGGDSIKAPVCLLASGAMKTWVLQEQAISVVLICMFLTAWFLLWLISQTSRLMQMR